MHTLSNRTSSKPRRERLALTLALTIAVKCLVLYGLWYACFSHPQTRHMLLPDGQLSGFATTPLVEEELRYICRADAPLAGRAGVTLREALDTTLILPGLQHGVRPRIESTARASGLHARDIIEINSIAILKSAILAGMGATILPVAPVLAEVERGAMRALPIHDPSIARTVVLCASRNIPLTNAAAAVGRLVGQVAHELCASGAWIGARPLP